MKKLDDERDWSDKANALVQLGDASGVSPKAADAFSKAVRLFHAHENNREEAEALVKLGNTYRGLGNLSAALAQYEAALSIFKRINNASTAASVAEQIKSLAATLQP